LRIIDGFITSNNVGESQTDRKELPVSPGIKVKTCLSTPEPPEAETRA